jgi:hypothetical protein
MSWRISGLAMAMRSRARGKALPTIKACTPITQTLRSVSKRTNLSCCSVVSSR